jgi:hypothetical protein
MKPTVTIAAVLLLAVGAHASEVFKSTDTQGRPVYTDKPQRRTPWRFSGATRRR